MKFDIETLKAEQKTLGQKIMLLREEMKEKSKELMKAGFRDFFEKYDGAVHAIFWTQFTPFFSDGEECIFSVNDIYIALTEDDLGEHEGSEICNTEDLKNLQRGLEEARVYFADPYAAAVKYREEWISKYKRDPFDTGYRWSNKTPEENMRNWNPYYQTLAEMEDNVAVVEEFVKNYPNLADDFRELVKIVSSIEDGLMNDMFGDHVKVIVTKSGIETEEYDHD
ncbi:MAG: hypothetical protein WCY93_07820 [Anaerolineaceae bacterium]